MPKIVDHDARRAEIAEAAARAIDEHGLERVRLVDVARRASCTTGAVAHYFPDKDAVLAAALEHVLGNLGGYFPPEEAWPPEAGDPVQRFLDLLAEILPIDEPRRSHWRVWIAFCGRAVGAPELAARHREAYAEIQRSLEAALAAAGLAVPGHDTAPLAVAVFASFDGLGLRATLEPADWPEARLRSMLAYQLTPLLRAGHPAPAFETEPHARELSA